MRFQKIENNPQYPADADMCWYWDTEQPVPTEDGPQSYVAVRVASDKDPTQCVRVEKLRLLFTDQAEYYAVCLDCHSAYYYMQWSGSTRSPGWQKASQQFLERHKARGWCEFCDPVFGNGGWVVDSA